MWENNGVMQREMDMRPTIGERSLLGTVAVMTLLLIGVVGYGVAIQMGALTPPERDVRLGRFRIAAYTTNDPAYPATFPQLLELRHLPPKRFYVVWILARSGWPSAVARDIDHEIGIRLLTLYLCRRS
jgi:hypothetical protein